MTQNLRIGNNNSTTILKPDDSDVSENFTLEKATTGWLCPNINCNNKQYLYSGDNALTCGNYYLYTTATAMSGSGVSYGKDAPNSICPRGWRLPTKTEANNLITYYTQSDYTRSPINFNNCGVYEAGNISYSYSWLWLSTKGTRTDGYIWANHLVAGGNSPSWTPGAGVWEDWDRGASVRCILK